MKLSHNLILIVFLLLGCQQKKNDKFGSQIDSMQETKKVSESIISKSAKDQDTIHNYWEIITDTVSSKKEYPYQGRDYLIKLKTFSLNDSGIVRNLSRNEPPIYLDHSHTIVTDLTLFNDSIIDKKRIERTVFEKVLIPEFYAECNLFSTQIDSIDKNYLYLNSELNVPDTDNHWKVIYSIEILDNQLGKLEIKESNYVGM